METSICSYSSKRSKFRGSFNGVCFLVLVFLCVLQNPFSKKPASNFAQKIRSEDNLVYVNSLNSSNIQDEDNNLRANRNPSICTGIHQHEGYDTKCEYLKANPDCNSGGVFHYIEFFYCDCNNFKVVGYVVLGIWLLALFYLLGNTAADYFCICLEHLSSILKLPPTLAGVTLLPLGNGAPDVFASIAAFVGKDSGDVGLNSVLGGAVFVTCIVVGTVSLCIAGHKVRIDKKCFIRDVSFFLITIVGLLVILVVGEVSVGGAIAFVSIYVVYALCVAIGEILRKHGKNLKLGLIKPLLPVTDSENVEDESVRDSLLESDSEDNVPHLRSKLHRWRWSSNVAIFSNESVKKEENEENPHNCLWGWNDNEMNSSKYESYFSCAKICSILELPLALPRKLTIPIVEEERWSKMYAVASASLAPSLLALLWSTQDSVGLLAKILGFLIGAITGGILGTLAFKYTSHDEPPQKFLFPWVLGGFLMSIIWFYIIANELVALLLGFGIILGITPSLLALTILAWGNSMGDLMSNVALAMEGQDGVQIAMSGCYAGPMFNTLVGLGISLLIGALSKKPASYVVPRDASLYSTLGFLILGLLWSLIVLPRNGMRPNKVLGVGLMVIYVGFLAIRVTVAMGDGSVHGSG